MTMTDMVWDDSPAPEAPFFTRDLYDKYSLSPNIRELWAILHSSVENANAKQGCDAGSAKAPSSRTTEEEVDELKDSSCVGKEEPCAESCNDDDDDDDDDDDFQDGDDDEAQPTAKSKKAKKAKKEPESPFPEPRLPYPCMSSLSSKEQETYLGVLTSKKARDPPQRLKAKVNNEVMQFMRYLQDVARMCADDYNFISHGAMQYSEDVLRHCLDCIKTFPQLYQIHEMTSLTGGTFDPHMKLTFEKQLLIMGSVDITDHMVVPADAPLASDYQSVSSEHPAAKKAKDMHAMISTDGNAEKLSDRYEPHACLTREALVRLLDNHGPDFGEQWELPVHVKSNTGKGLGHRKTVYIDSPILKTEMTARERSHIYHEESLKLSIKRNGSKNVFHLLTELHASEQQVSPENLQRHVVSTESTGLDFEVDLTDLETFGEAASVKTPKVQKTQTEKDARVESQKATGPPPSVPRTRRSSERLAKISPNAKENRNNSSADTDDPVSEEIPHPVIKETTGPKTEQTRPDSGQDSDVDVPFMGDSDDEKLIIDDVSVSPCAEVKDKPEPKASPHPADPSITPVSVDAQSPSPRRGTRQRQQSRKVKESGDQLGQILKMQTAMFKPASDGGAKCSAASQEIASPSRCGGPPVYSHPTSLVKPCVSSYLERNPNQDREDCTAPHQSAPPGSNTRTEHKRILSQDLQAGAEDEQDYQAPEEGNLVYKLYSLQDLLLMVRSSVALTHTRKVDHGPNQHVPVHVLPKLEYQLSYGVECLNRTEACQLWTETLLQSSTVSYIAHINAHTSTLALCRKLPDDWKHNLSCGFTPAKSLNILQHLLKKLTKLDEGHYLMAHKSGEPFVTLLKAASGKVTRGTYDLQQAHGALPRPPGPGLLPWIPVDPAVVLPFHRRHGRVPCTFPPKTPKERPWQPGGGGAGQSNNKNRAGKRANRNTKKRAAKRNKYIQNLIKKSV